MVWDIISFGIENYFKFFKKTTILITSLLLLVTAAGIGYLFIPTFFIEGQTNLVDALKIGGEIYAEKYFWACRNEGDLLPLAWEYKG